MLPVAQFLHILHINNEVHLQKNHVTVLKTVHFSDITCALYSKRILTHATVTIKFSCGAYILL